MMYLTKVSNAPKWMQVMAHDIVDEAVAPNFVAVYSESFYRMADIDLAAAIRGMVGNLEAPVVERHAIGHELAKKYGFDGHRAQFTTPYIIFVG